MMSQKLAEYHTGYRAFSREILEKLETEAPHAKKQARQVLATTVKGRSEEVQLLMFEPKAAKDKKAEPILSELRKLDLNCLTPIEAHQKLLELKEMLKETKDGNKRPAKHRKLGHAGVSA